MAKLRAYSSDPALTKSELFWTGAQAGLEMAEPGTLAQPVGSCRGLGVRDSCPRDHPGNTVIVLTSLFRFFACSCLALSKTVNTLSGGKFWLCL